MTTGLDDKITKALEWLETYKHGHVNSHQWRLEWISHNGQFVLVHIPGGSFWNGWGMSYGEVDRIVIDITTGAKLTLNGATGTKIKTFHCRYSKKFIQDIETLTGKKGFHKYEIHHND